MTLLPLNSRAIDDEDRGEYDVSMSQELKVWSNHRVRALKQMLFEQEEIDEDQMQCSFFKENEDGELVSLDMDMLMQDVLPTWPVKDEDGKLDAITIPEIRIHARFQLTCIVSIVTHPEIEPFMYHLSGAENIHQVEDKMLESILALDPDQARHLPPLEDMKIAFISSDNLMLNKAYSIWKVAEDTCEDFNPSKSIVQLTVTLDDYEEFILGRPFDNFIMISITANTFFLAAEHFEASDGWVLAQDVAEWVIYSYFI